jgi:hypothetical protein
VGRVTITGTHWTLLVAPVPGISGRFVAVSSAAEARGYALPNMTDFPRKPRHESASDRCP